MITDQSEDTEVVNAVTAAMREADRVFEKVGGSTRHHVRDCLLPVLNRNGWRVVKAKPVCPCGLSDEPWHFNGICAEGSSTIVAPASGAPTSTPLDAKSSLLEQARRLEAAYWHIPTTATDDCGLSMRQVVRLAADELRRLAASPASALVTGENK
jgi:hypothetical protein